jgi:hypothetical protein
MPALKTIRNAGEASDPYVYLATCIFDQIFRDIASYYSQVGTKEDRQEGYRAIKWLKNMEGNFRVLSSISPDTMETFHQKCIRRINEIKSNERLRQEILKRELTEEL